MTKISSSDDLEVYQYSIIARSGTLEERNAWFKENDIDDFRQMIFARDKHYYIFRNAEDALKFKVVWG